MKVKRAFVLGLLACALLPLAWRGRGDLKHALLAAAAPPSPALPAPPPAEGARIALRPVLSGLAQPLALVAAPEKEPRLFIVEKTGRIQIWRPPATAVEAAPYLDVSARVSLGWEQGLLGLAFHPKYADNGRFFINYTDQQGDTHVLDVPSVDRPQGTGAGVWATGDLGRAKELLFVKQPYANHNGGHLLFGPDGKLWVGLGDGGSGGDPRGNAQNPSSWLGKMLLIDVDAPRPVPVVAALGLRNPWRYAFDPATDDLYIGDVGQNVWEEVDVWPAARVRQAGRAGTKPLNFGWNRMEGNHAYGLAGAATAGLELPVAEYSHAAGCSVTGGIVYRGRALPEIAGRYFYADYCTALIRSFRYAEGRVTEHHDWRATLDPESRLAQIASFGQDAAGEMYLVSLDGTIYKFVRGG